MANPSMDCGQGQSSPEPPSAHTLLYRDAEKSQQHRPKGENVWGLARQSVREGDGEADGEARGARLGREEALRDLDSPSRLRGAGGRQGLRGRGGRPSFARPVSARPRPEGAQTQPSPQRWGGGFVPVLRRGGRTRVPHQRGAGARGATPGNTSRVARLL
ncbi:hypothetical protein P7K49_002195 [Saguinus oedipus]|uniref:Uncharacterized protein n=1 Tax=Saguinus oedipus TaxID=9490 RepID=A0ABQ9WGN3_SAGOE|nr:hypothetical protein P7K49_002195 [Saguinus oedipus]